MSDTHLIEEALTAHFGEQCPDFDEGCFGCRAWAQFDALIADKWQDISTAHDLDSVLVSGWQKPSKRVAGYWWVHEDFIVNGKPDAHPDALLWQPFPSPPSTPSPHMERAAS